MGTLAFSHAYGGERATCGCARGTAERFVTTGLAQLFGAQRSCASFGKMVWSWVYRKCMVRNSVFAIFSTKREFELNCLHILRPVGVKVLGELLHSFQDTWVLVMCYGRTRQSYLGGFFVLLRPTTRTYLSSVAAKILSTGIFTTSTFPLRWRGKFKIEFNVSYGGLRRIPMSALS